MQAMMDRIFTKCQFCLKESLFKQRDGVYCAVKQSWTGKKKKSNWHHYRMEISMCGIDFCHTAALGMTDVGTQIQTPIKENH